MDTPAGDDALWHEEVWDEWRGIYFLWSNLTHLQSVRLWTFPESDAEDFEMKQVRYMQVYIYLGKTKGKGKEKKSQENIIYPLIDWPEIRCLNQYHACPKLFLEKRGRNKNLQRD